MAGVGVLVEKKVDNVMEVKRVSERILTVRVRVEMKILNLISVYAPQVGRTRAEKEEFYEKLFEVVSAINDKESLFLCENLNSHVRQRVECFEGVHGGFGFDISDLLINIFLCPILNPPLDKDLSLCSYKLEQIAS